VPTTVFDAAPGARDFLLPDVGEGLTEATILSWSVRPGDRVEVNQVIVEIETAKAAVELPSPYAGTVAALHAQQGDTVDVGRPIVTITADPEPGTSPEPEPADAALGGEAKLLVGYGARERPTTRRRRPAPVKVPRPVAGRTRVAAKPPVRKLAKELGIDLRAIRPTGPGDTVSRDDVRAAAAAVSEAPAPTAAAAVQALTPERETRVPVRGVRKHTAAAMVASAFTAPHVTEFVTVDVTETLGLRERVAARREFAGVRVTPLLFVARALLLALRRTPEANASWDEAAGEIVLKHYVNLGVAAATERGLIVPNIKDADRLSLRDLAGELAELTATARAGRTSPAAMSGGTVTITNVGVFGVDTGTPILNPGEAAILAFGAVRRMPWVVDTDGVERIEPRSVTQLALSFDHRLVDGQQGSQLLADTAATLTDPTLAML